MALTPAQQDRLNALKAAFGNVWQRALLGLEYCGKVQERADDSDLKLTDAQKQVALAKVTALIDAVDAGNTTLKALR
jgi:hypothetical protein